jgi:formamidopyrimidine-DNA glycosylase
VGKIPETAMTALHQSIGIVLREAIESIRRIAPDIYTGEERSFFKVHNKKYRQTETGADILVERIAGKTTYFTKEQVSYF